MLARRATDLAERMVAFLLDRNREQNRECVCHLSHVSLYMMCTVFVIRMCSCYCWSGASMLIHVVTYKCVFSLLDL